MRTYLAEFRKGARMLELLEEAASYDPEVREARIDLRERMSRTTAHFIGNLLADGEIDEDLDIEYVSVLIGAMVDRVAYVWFVFGRDFDEDRVIKQLRDAQLADDRLARPLKRQPDSPDSDQRDPASGTDR